MRTSVALLALVMFACGLAVGFVQQKPSTREGAQRPPEAQQEMQAVKADLQRMRSLLAQMETNVGFVSNAQDPLKHQFQLEIEMWRVLLDDMERRTRSAPPR